MSMSSSISGLDITTDSQSLQMESISTTISKQQIKKMLNRLMLLFILNIVDILILAFFICFDIVVQPEPILISADIFYALSLLMLAFAIKFKHSHCWSMAMICQLGAFGLKVGGYFYASSQGVRVVTAIMVLNIALFTIVPLGVSKYWDKIEEDKWIQRFDKESKMQNYKLPNSHFEHQ